VDAPAPTRSYRSTALKIPANLGAVHKNLEGYRRLTFMMLDADIVVVSPSSV
jgi:hypothetical protein